jgi:hypothetical protein
MKLHLALDIYRGLGAIPVTSADTLTKVMSMLLHPFPKVCNTWFGWKERLTQEQVRMTAAETLWILTREQSLKLQDWSLPSKSLKPAVEDIKKSIMVGGN